MPAKLRAAVIGRTGRGNYGHGLDVVWKTIADAEVVAVADPDEKGRAAAIKRIGSGRGYADFRDMLDKEKPHVVSVADRHLDLHRDYVVACAKAGASMFLEKPMARTLAEADEMVKACETHHVKVAIAHQTRYSPKLARVKELLAAGTLGDLVEMRGRGKEDARSGGQDLMVLGTHVLDLMRFVAGDAKWVSARVTKVGKVATKADIVAGGEGMGNVLGDAIHATYGFDGGVVGTFATRKASHGVGTRFGLTLYGTKGMITTGTGSLPPVWLCEDPSWGLGRAKGKWREITSAGLDKPEPLKDGGLGQGNTWIVNDLLEAIRKDRQPLGSMYDGRAALEMILGVYASHLKGGAAVEVPMKERGHPLG